VASFYEHGNESSGPINDGQFLDQLNVLLASQEVYPASWSLFRKLSENDNFSNHLQPFQWQMLIAKYFRQFSSLNHEQNMPLIVVI
jgi:hypothetical protein